MTDGDLSAGYRARTLRWNDLPSVFEMVTACSLTDEGRVSHTMHDLEVSYEMPRFEPEVDTSIVLDEAVARLGIGLVRGSR